ncbi:hypothetical protein GCM10009104_07770 [Marinobacterium maritimum]|uniref:CSD domain-containing protein n=1 Tax=Marinobacterium maritimum TaxID=500162 RepID=A0ABN1I362_9GAMM
MECQKGTLKTWKDDRGFGFIKPDDGGPDLFVHIRDFGSIPRKPQSGDRIQYQPMKDQQGRWRAADVQIEGLRRSASSPKNKPKARPRSRHGKRSKMSRSPLMGRVVSLILLVMMILAGLNFFDRIRGQLGLADPSLSSEEAAGDSRLQHLYDSRRSDVQVQGAGVVSRILPDDTVGSRHQKFILRLGSGQTLLISHNIDLAPRIPSLSVGDRVSFNGEYEWNDRGGVVHWTHHDPAGRHEGGWLKHQGRTYQ